MKILQVDEMVCDICHPAEEPPAPFTLAQVESEDLCIAAGILKVSGFRLQGGFCVGRKVVLGLRPRL